MDRRGGERPHADRTEHKDPDPKEESEDDDEPPGELKEKALLVSFRELMHHPVRSKSSRVLKDAPPSPDSSKPTLGHYFLSPKHAPPREQTCTTKHAPPVRFRP